MGPLVAVPMIFGAVMIWAFLHYSPPHENLRAVALFNRVTLVLGAGIAVVWYFTMQAQLLGLGLGKYVNFVCLGGGGGILFVYFGAFLLVRNFYVFRDKNFNPNTVRR